MLSEWVGKFWLWWKMDKRRSFFVGGFWNFWWTFFKIFCNAKFVRKMKKKLRKKYHFLQKRIPKKFIQPGTKIFSWTSGQISSQKNSSNFPQKKSRCNQENSLLHLAAFVIFHFYIFFIIRANDPNNCVI